jgi:hypothetical protein
MIIEALEGRALLATNGLSATYFDRTSFTGRTTSRIDASVNFDWGNHQRPAPAIVGDTFSVRWNGLVKPAATEVYRFSLRHNDGARLWVNGRLLIDNWKVGPRVTDSGAVALKARRLYDIRLEYFDFTRTAAVQLQWSSASTPLSVVPRSRLFAYDVRIGSIGDYGKENDFAVGTAKLVKGWNPQSIITLGDNYYDGVSAIDDNIGEEYQAYIGNYKGDHGPGAMTNQFFPSLGNHDYEDGGAAYFNYFTLPGNERYYDFVRGPIHFFVVNSDPHEPDGTSPTSVQGQWLQNALAASSSAHDVVYFHFTAYGSGSEGSSTYMRWPFLEWGADAVLAGHNHHYERLYVGGLTYIVNGAGGGPDSIGSPISGSLVRDDSDSGAMLIQANDLAITFQYQLRSGEVLDTLTVRSN